MSRTIADASSQPPASKLRQQENCIEFMEIDATASMVEEQFRICRLMFGHVWHDEYLGLQVIIPAMAFPLMSSARICPPRWRWNARH